VISRAVAITRSIFRPKERRRQPWRGRWQERLRPVFPGHLFPSPHADRRSRRDIHSWRGFTRLVSFGDQGPSKVPAALVEAIRQRRDPDGLLRRRDGLAPGQKVRLLSGPFADTVARIEALAPKARAVRLIDLMGRSVRATVAAAANWPPPAPHGTRP
jgi:transcriptional antiterminator RfaH